MDREVFLALTILASSAAVSPVFAGEVRRAEAEQNTRHITRVELVRAIYDISLCPGGVGTASRALVELGHSRVEADEMARLGADIARKSGSYGNFFALLDGQKPRNVVLSEREVALLRSLVRRASASRLHTKWDGRTWEGSASKIHTKWDGRTWEGSAN